MSRFRFTWLIRASLGLGLMWTCSAATTAYAGLDQLWFLGEDSQFQPLYSIRYAGDILFNGSFPENANIVSMKDYNCIDASGDSAANGTPVITYTCKPGSNPGDWNQRWRSNPDPTQGWAGAGTFQNGYWTYYPGTGKSYIPPAILPTGASNAPWFSIAVGDNWGACIDVPAGNDANGQYLQIYECNGTPAQVWRSGISAYGESPFWIRSNITGQGANRCWTNWGNVVLYDCAYDF